MTEDEIEYSFDLCNAHYQGMREAYIRILRALEQDHPIDDLKQFCKDEIKRLQSYKPR